MPCLRVSIVRKSDPIFLIAFLGVSSLTHFLTSQASVLMPPLIHPPANFCLAIGLFQPSQSAFFNRQRIDICDDCFSLQFNSSNLQYTFLRRMSIDRPIPIGSKQLAIVWRDRSSLVRPAL